MNPYYADDAVTLWHGDCLDVLATLRGASVDAVVTDPPYALEFMGKEWDSFGRQDVRQRGDSTFTQGDRRHGLVRHGVGGSYGGDTTKAMRAFGAWCELWAAECLRVLKPGGHMLAFGGTRTWHRLACAVEDAGFEVRDSIAWLYGSGFPKSLDVSKAIDKAAGAERAVLGDGPNARRRPNPIRTGTAFSDDACVWGQGDPITAPATDAARQWQGWGTALKPAFEPIVVARKPLTGTVASNVLAYGTGALHIDACRVGPGSEVPGGGGFRGGATSRHEGWTRPSHADGYATEAHTAGRWPANVVLDDVQAAELDQQSGTLTSGALDRSRITARNGDGWRYNGERTGTYEADSGGASRFFPVFRYEPKAPTAERPRGDDGTAHPTVKPLDLMRWLVRLVCPPGGVVLDPFLGSGTTAEACIVEGFRCIGVERDEGYLRLAAARLAKPIAPVLFGEGTA